MRDSAAIHKTPRRAALRLFLQLSALWSYVVRMNPNDEVQNDRVLPARVRRVIKREWRLGISYRVLSLMSEAKMRAIKGLGPIGLESLRVALRARRLQPFQAPPHFDSGRMRARAAKVARDHGREDIARAIEGITL